MKRPIWDIPVFNEKLKQADALDVEVKAATDANRVYREKAKNLRISAGIDLIELRRLVLLEALAARDPRPVDRIWKDYCVVNFPKYSASKIARVIASVQTQKYYGKPA